MFLQRLSGHLSNALMNLVIYLLIQVLSVKSCYDKHCIKCLLGRSAITGMFVMDICNNDNWSSSDIHSDSTP